jgi:hypothetical protein
MRIAVVLLLMTLITATGMMVPTGTAEKVTLSPFKVTTATAPVPPT